MGKVEVITKVFDTSPPVIFRQEIDRELLAKNLREAAESAKRHGLRPGQNHRLSMMLGPAIRLVASADKLATVQTVLQSITEQKVE